MQTGTHAPLRHCQRQLVTLRELISSDELGCQGTGLLASWATMLGPCMQHARSGTGSSFVSQRRHAAGRRASLIPQRPAAAATAG